MENNKDIDPKDSNGQVHGYQEWYLGGRLWVRVNYKHGLEIGYEENHGIIGDNDRSGKTNFYIK